MGIGHLAYMDQERMKFHPLLYGPFEVSNSSSRVGPMQQLSGGCSNRPVCELGNPF